ncbi:response regulator transcription factor [Lacticaseibacillus kribbianus]|uniref:response regulator transcription factor n=1 Tax=Lacticaseibacillus kribbianus TaxID=2926292 RepID=UPI001CD4BF98|nr:response regulator transcription factor [Lacticaseibacillus kribbianus]
MVKIMLIEDEGTVAELLAKALRKWQFEVQVVTDFTTIERQVADRRPELILLDINLPVYDGFYWMQKIRDFSQVPVIFISSRDADADQIMAMNLGGDDYIQKPFDMDVLIAKVNAMLRRTYQYRDDATALAHNGVSLNVQTREVLVGEQQITLSTNEFQLLWLLMRAHGHIVTRDELLNKLWQDKRFVDDNTLTVNISRLRQKIAAAGVDQYIVTRVAQGYMVP